MTRADTPTTLTARTPEDLLALVPVVLGFVPEHSVAMLTFGHGRTFHARLDLPDPARGPANLADYASVLLEPARRHRVGRVAFVLYTDDRSLGRSMCQALLTAFTPTGIEVADVLRAEPTRWFPMLPGQPPETYAGVRYDVSAHPFAVRSVVDGHVVHRSRRELAESLVGPSDRVAAVADTLGRLPALDARVGEAELAWVGRTVERLVADPGPIEDADVARLLRALEDGAIRDLVWATLSRSTAQGHVDLWSDVVRRCPDRFLATPAVLLGYAAWLAGWGALAWCALDRCFAVAPDHLMGRHLADALVMAIPPPPGTRSDAREGTRGGGERRASVSPWALRWMYSSSREPTGPATARRCAAAWTSSRGCCARPASTPTTR